jgi:hypothetical protein
MARPSPRFIAELVVNLFLPWLCYRFAEPRWGEFAALVVSSVPPLLWSLGELAWHRRIDALSVLVLGGIALSVAAMAAGGSPKLLLVRESLLSGLIGVLFLASLLSPKPLIYHLARATVLREDAERAEAFEEWWAEPSARRAVRTMTFVWGLGLTGEAALRSWLAWEWPPERFLAVAPTMGYVVLGLMFAWTFWYRRRLHRSNAG